MMMTTTMLLTTGMMTMLSGDWLATSYTVTGTTSMWLDTSLLMMTRML